MKRYKITYNGVDYDRVAYTDIDKCIQVMEDAKEQFPSIDFKINEID